MIYIKLRTNHPIHRYGLFTYLAVHKGLDTAIRDFGTQSRPDKGRAGPGSYRITQGVVLDNREDQDIEVGVAIVTAAGRLHYVFLRKKEHGEL